LPPESPESSLRKLYVDGGSVEIAAHVVYELDANGKQLRVVKFTDYASENVRNLWTSAAELRAQWGNAEERAAIIHSLEERGITLDQLAENMKIRKQAESEFQKRNPQGAARVAIYGKTPKMTWREDGSVSPSPRRARRSITGMIEPRRLMTPRM
jgi:hypothetical protein